MQMSQNLGKHESETSSWECDALYSGVLNDHELRTLYYPLILLTLNISHSNSASKRLICVIPHWVGGSKMPHAHLY